MFPYKITKDKKGNYSINLSNEIKQLEKHLINNKDFYKGNKDYQSLTGSQYKKAVEDYMISYVANRFMAQQLFVHDHTQSDNEVDYIKRTAGAIASHTVFDRNVMIEPVIIKDYYSDKEFNIFTEEKEGTFAENDAMGYILPEQAKAITSKYGDTQKVGSVFKFVYHYTQTEGSFKGETTYLE